MSIKTTFAALSALALLAGAASAESYRTGMTKLHFPDAEQGRDLQGYLWYPTEETEGVTRAHGNAVWESVRVIPDAVPAAGARPLVLLSHGMFGNSNNQAWLADALANEGYLVAAIDHPGTSTFMRDPLHQRQLWERPRDLSRMLDKLLDDPAVNIDSQRVFMAGHSLGGFTAVMLAGGRFDPDHWDRFCAPHPDELVCAIFNRWQVARSPEDRAAMAGNYSDDRISGFTVFDLGGTQTFSPESLGKITTPMLVFGAPIANSGLDLDIESRALVEALPKETVQYLEPETLSHFDFLAVCTEQALDILKEENPSDLFVCKDGTDQRRLEHAKIAGQVAEFFGGL